MSFVVSFQHFIFALMMENMDEQVQLSGNSPMRNLLDDTELKIVKMICVGYNTVQISAELFRSPRTVEGYRANILRKIGAKNSIDLLRYAFKYGLISKEDL